MKCKEIRTDNVDKFYSPEESEYFMNLHVNDPCGEVKDMIYDHDNMVDDEYEDVKKFQTKYGMIVSESPQYLTKRKLIERIEFMQEELDEFTDAASTGNIVDMADALIDLVYVIKGTAVSMGLPWRPLWNDVHRANMEKVRGVSKRGHKVDCIKPDGWKGPNTLFILREFGLKIGQKPIDDKEYVDGE